MKFILTNVLALAITACNQQEPEAQGLLQAQAEQFQLSHGLNPHVLTLSDLQP
jgi:hypothetical protein